MRTLFSSSFTTSISNVAAWVRFFLRNNPKKQSSLETVISMTFVTVVSICLGIPAVVMSLLYSTTVIADLDDRAEAAAEVERRREVDLSMDS
jgi:RsiW-degrading membrane proteinase PrsW (M82 family)